MRIQPISMLLLLMLLLLLWGCPPQQPPETQQERQRPSPTQGETVSVVILGFAFVPAETKIKTGTTIVWKNEDDVVHTVESTDGTLRSDDLQKGNTYSYTFTKPGIYKYICGLHPAMKGSVTVE